MPLEEVVQHLGKPTPPNRMPQRSSLPAGLRRVIDAGENGRYADGLLSVWSDRECVDSLAGWEVWLPPDSFIFASTAFGFSLVWGADRAWILSPQYGQVVESNLTPEECIQKVGTREKDLRSELFRSWKSSTSSLGLNEVLATVPLLGLGGTWNPATLHPESFEVFLGITAGLFGPDSDMPAEVRRNT